MNYANVTVRDMCYFLNGRADKLHNEKLFGNCLPEDFPDSEMWLFLQLKSNNFNTELFKLLIFDIRTHPIQYALKIENEFIDLYDVDLSNSKLQFKSIPGEKLHEAIQRDLNDNSDLILYSDQIIVFSKMAEDIFDKLSMINTQKKAEEIKYKNQIPEELTTDKAKEILSRAIDAGFVSESESGYEWKGSRPQLAYFAQLASEKLNTTKFKPYEVIFGKKYLAQEAKKTEDMKGSVVRQKEIDNIFK